jgi:hypothetical protein
VAFDFEEPPQDTKNAGRKTAAIRMKSERFLPASAARAAF